MAKFIDEHCPVTVCCSVLRLFAYFDYSANYLLTVSYLQAVKVGKTMIYSLTAEFQVK